MPDKCLDCPAPSADMDGFIVSGPGGAPRSEGSGVSSPEGPFAREAPQTGHVIIMGTLGADGNPGALPDAPQVGWAYVAEDAGAYGGVHATEGDTVYCKSLNPTRWGIWQSDSDDSGRDLVSVSAAFGCDSMENYAPYGPVAEIVVYDSGRSAIGRSNNISAPGGLLEVPPLQDVSWQLQDPDFSAAAFVSVRFTSAEHYADSHSIYECLVSMSSWEALSSGDVLFCETSCSVNCLGPERCELEVVSAPSSGGRTFQIRAAGGPSLSLTSVKASGASSVQTVDMSCMNGRYGALESVSASFACGSGGWQPAVPYYATVNVACTFYDGTLPPVDPASSMDLPVSYSAFVFKGSDFEQLTDAIRTTSDIVMSVSYGGQPLYYVARSDAFSGFFSGNVHVGAVRHFINSRLGFRLESREELTSQDPGGPDIVCTFRLIRDGGDFLVLKSESAAGDSEEQIIDLSCLHADSLVDAGVYFSCDPSPAVSFVYDRADGTQSTQAVDMSCLVPPVFDGSADGLVPASGAVQNYLLAGDGTWMRPMTDAEIDALFAE